jgi:protein SCO1/2
MANFRRLICFWFLCAALLAGCSSKPPQWDLTNVQGHLPDLEFSLQTDTGHAVTERDYRGKIVLLYFGYTHCPDVCPMTMARLAAAMRELRRAAGDVRILFVSVDPARDKPALLHSYVNAFDPHAVGLLGKSDAIEAMAKRYRVAFEPVQPGVKGNYEVTHSPAVYIFDKSGHARLLAAPNDSVESIVHDIRQLLQTP